MTALPPDQLQAIQAVLAQQGGAQAEHIAQSITVTVQSSPVDVNALARLLLIEGTASKATALDQLLLRTGQGDFLLKLPQDALRQLQDNLPGRVTLQLRPGPNGLEAILVVGSRAAQAAGQVEQSLASNAALSRQTLTTEIPKIGQVFQVTVLPSTLLSNLLYNQNKAAVLKQAPNLAGSVPQTQTPTTAPTVQAGAEQTAGTIKEADGKAAGTTSTPTPVQTSQVPIKNLNEGTAGSRNNYEKDSTQGQQQQAQSQTGGKLPSPDAEEALKIPLPIAQTQKPQLLPLRILGVDTLPNDKSLTAVVRGATPSGQPILTIDDQVAVVNTTKNWPVGTKIQIVLGAGAELVTVKAEHQAPTSFESLRQIFEILSQQNPLLINEVKRFRVPNAASGQLAGGLLFLLSAVQKGNSDAWLGNDVKDALEGLGKQSVLSALKSDFENSKLAATDSAGSPWRGTTVPYLEGDKLQQFRFFVHDDPRQRKPGQSERDIARRFLIDVSLTRLGPIQIDGLVHQRKLDLIVRTTNHLAEDLRNDLRVRFAHAMEEVKYNGSLMFQANKQGWVDIKAKPNQHLSKSL